MFLNPVLDRLEHLKKKSTKSDFMNKVVVYVKRDKKYKTEEPRSVLFSFISSILTFLLVS